MKKISHIQIIGLGLFLSLASIGLFSCAAEKAFETPKTIADLSALELSSAEGMAALELALKSGAEHKSLADPERLKAALEEHKTKLEKEKEKIYYSSELTNEKSTEAITAYQLKEVAIATFPTTYAEATATSPVQLYTLAEGTYIQITQETAKSVLLKEQKVSLKAIETQTAWGVILLESKAKIEKGKEVKEMLPHLIIGEVKATASSTKVEWKLQSSTPLGAEDKITISTTFKTTTEEQEISKKLLTSAFAE